MLGKNLLLRASGYEHCHRAANGLLMSMGKLSINAKMWVGCCVQDRKGPFSFMIMAPLLHVVPCHGFSDGLLLLP
jgi:hypothetical protein